jgi:two-component sensor histidine kinase
LAVALQDATKLTQQVAEQSGAHATVCPRKRSQTTGPSRPVREGIGLSIVKRLADLLNASVELDSEKRAGTTFKVLFPRSYDL